MLLANTAQIRKADQIQIFEKKLPGIILMEEAGSLSAKAIQRHYPDQKSFLIAAGPGNNGGDGLVIARYLHLTGREVQVLLSHPIERYEGDAKINYQVLAELPVPLILYGEEPLEVIVNSFMERPLLIDALLGTGIQSELREPASLIIRELSTFSLRTIAIDLPSGLGAHTGELINMPLKADLTLTFQLPKICHAVMPAAASCGKIEVLDIGIWPEVITALDIQRRLLDPDFLKAYVKDRQTEGHKGSFGHVLAVGGSENMAGAISMTAYAGMRAGAGLFSVLCPEEVKQTVLNHSPEVMCRAGEGKRLTSLSLPLFDEMLKEKKAVVMGPGMDTQKESLEFFKEALPMIQVPLVLDADALNLLAANPELWAFLPESTILTPHPGEMKRLSGLENVNDRRLETAERMAQDREVIVVLKGSDTLIALPDGRTFVNPTGNPGMGTGGSGDVLTGIIGALLAQGYEPWMAACLGVFAHGQAGDRAAAKLGMGRMTALDIARQLNVDKL